MGSDDFEFMECGDVQIACADLTPLLTPTEICIPLCSLVEERQYRIVLSEFMAAWPDLETPLRKALFAYYTATKKVADDCGPDILYETKIWEYVSVQSITVPELCAHARFVQMLGSCTWEEEHGLEVCVRNGNSILYVGAFTGKSHREPNFGEPWNYASSA